MDFKNKNVLITGASRGIGKATAIAFADKGANVGINYKNNKQEAEKHSMHYPAISIGYSSLI